jgi:dipeptidyl aminopeptidase/acylaminoacyl peptidase
MRPFPRRRLAIAVAALAMSFPLAGSAQISAATVQAATSLPPVQELFTAEDVLGINSYSIGDMTDDGLWLALTMTTRRDGFGNDYRRDGDPTYVRPSSTRLWIVDAKTKARTEVFPDKRGIRGVRFSPDGSQLAMLLWTGSLHEPAIYDRATKKVTVLKLPADRYVAENSDIRWSGDGSALVVAVHTLEWKKKATDLFKNITDGPVFVQSSKDPFLTWDDLRRMANKRSVGSVDVKSGQYRELVAEMQLGTYTLSEDGKSVTYAEDLTKATSYEAGTNENRLTTKQLATGTTRQLFATGQSAPVVWAEDGRRYAFTRAGRVYLASIDDTTTKFIAGPPEPPPGTTPAPADSTGRGGRGGGGRGGGRGGAAGGNNAQNFTASRFSPRGDLLLVTNREGMWVVDLATNAREMAIATGDTTSAAPRITFAAWSDDGTKLYFTTASRTKWERGVVRYDRTSKQIRELVKDGRSYSGLRLSKDGTSAFLNVADGNRLADIYSANGDLGDLRRFIVANPQLEAKRFGPTELMSYLDADGHKKYSVVHYPANYERGKAYPTVFIIYEEFFDDSWDVAANILAANGYVVVKPSVDFDTGYPGEAWLKGVTSMANKLIELGITDSTRLGVHGTSYGGYATNLLITQTNRFKAAINISGKVDIISFYTDSPRLGVRNITAAERSQDRIGATLWAQPQKYVAHSAIMFADRITTPLMLITGQQDSNVPADNTREMYYALRRLGKEVVWVNYMNGGHGGGNATADDFLDMYRRMVGWYDSKLKPAKAVP